MITPVSHIAKTAPYPLAPPPAPDQTVIAGLDKNESSFPPSPKAIAAAIEMLTQGHLYPDPDANALRAAISSIHGVEMDRVLCSAGSMELISALVHAYAGPGDRVLSTEYGYAFFRTATGLYGATYDVAPERGFRVDVDELLSAVRPETRLVFVANPGNPTGTFLPSSELVRLRESLPRHCLLVVDEAYGEFADDTSLENPKLATRDDTAILRTFSKAYALAGLRVGWGVFPNAIATEVRKTLNASNLTAPGAAAAAAAMEDQDYMDKVCRETSRLRFAFVEQLEQLGISIPVSRTNFVLVELGDAEKTARIDGALRSAGVFCRPMGGYGLPTHLRIAIGNDDAMRQTASILADHHHKEDSA